MDCLNNIIGLSETTCVCYDTGKPVDYNESKSALYLDQLEGLSLKLIPTDCGEGSLWDKMELARKNAILKFKSDLVSCLGTSNEFVRKPFKGKVGNESWSQTLVINKNFVGQEFCANNIEGGCLLIRSISTLMDTTTTFDLTIYNNISDTPLFLIPGLASEANVVKENVLGTPIELPLYTTECDNLIYYFVYEPVGFNPKNNEISFHVSTKEKSGINSVSFQESREMIFWTGKILQQQKTQMV